MAEDQYKKLMAHLSTQGPKPSSEEHVMKAVEARILKARFFETRVRVPIFMTLVVGSLATIKPAWDLLIQGASQTDFSEYLSLVTSGGSSVFGAWKELTISLVESLPMTESALFIAVVLLLFYSVKKVASFNTHYLFDYQPQTI